MFVQGLILKRFWKKWSNPNPKANQNPKPNINLKPTPFAKNLNNSDWEMNELYRFTYFIESIWF